jgi:hypothetical protein
MDLWGFSSGSPGHRSGRAAATLLLKQICIDVIVRIQIFGIQETIQHFSRKQPFHFLLVGTVPAADVLAYALIRLPISVPGAFKSPDDVLEEGDVPYRLPGQIQQLVVPFDQLRC